MNVATTAAVVTRASLAPSAHNAQPWNVNAIPGGLNVRLDQQRALKAGDPSGRQNAVSVGIFLEHLVAAAAAIGWRSRLEYECVVPQDDASTRLTFEADPQSIDGPEASLAAGIERRRTDRAAHHPTLQDAKAQQLLGIPAPAGTYITSVSDPTSKVRVGELVQAAMRLALQLPAMRRELAELVAWNENGPITRGMYLESMVTSASLPRAAVLTAGAWLIEQLDATSEAEQMGANYTQSPLLLVVSTDHDGPQAWLDAGRAAARIMPTGANLGLVHCVAAGPVEVPSIVPQLRALLATKTRPQLLMRLGEPIRGEGSCRAGRVVLM